MAMIDPTLKKQGLTCEVKLTEKHKNISLMTDEQLNSELEKGYVNMQAEQTILATEAFANIRKEYGV